MPHINIILFASLLHDSSSVVNSRQMLFEQLKRYADIEFSYPSEYAAKLRSNIRKSHIGRGFSYDGECAENNCESSGAKSDSITLCFIATGGTEEIFRPYAGILPHPIYILSDGLHNSFAASFEIATYLDNKGVANRLFNVPQDCDGSFFENMLNVIIHDSAARCTEDNGPAARNDAEEGSGSAALYAVDSGSAARNDADDGISREGLKTMPALPKGVMHTLSHTRIGLIGGASSWLIASGVDLKAVSDRYGVTFVNITTDELSEAFSKINDNPDETATNKTVTNKTVTNKTAINETVSRMSRYLAPDRSVKELEKAAIMYVAIRGLCSKYELNALTVKCFDILDSCSTTACLALALLNDEGIISGCEGDIPSLWTMLVVYLMHGKRSFMANPSSSNIKELTVDFAHCTIPLTMVHGYRLPSHFESSIGIAIQGSVPSGRYRLIKICGSSLDKFYSVEGDIIMNTNVPQRCRTQVRFRFDSKDDYDGFINHRAANHCILYPIQNSF